MKIVLYPHKDNSGKFGYIDSRKKFIIMPQFNEARCFKNEVAIVKLPEGYNVINKNGNLLFDIFFDSIDNYEATYSLAKLKKKNIIINNKGNIVCQKLPKGNITLGEKIYSIENKFVTLYNYDNVVISKRNYDSIDFGESFLHTAWKNEHFYIITNDGEEIFETEDILATYIGSYCLFCKNDKFGFIDEKFNVVAEPVYDDAIAFSSGYSIVQKEDVWFVLNENFEIIEELPISDIRSHSNKLIFYKKNNKFGVYEIGKGVLITPEYRFFDFNDDHFFLMNDRCKVFVMETRKFLLEENIEKSEFDQYVLFEGVEQIKDNSNNQPSLFSNKWFKKNFWGFKNWISFILSFIAIYGTIWCDILMPYHTEKYLVIISCVLGIILSVILLKKMNDPKSKFYQHLILKGKNKLRYKVLEFFIIPLLTTYLFVKPIPAFLNEMFGTYGSTLVYVEKHYTNSNCSNGLIVENYGYILNDKICGLNIPQYGDLIKGDSLQIFGQKSFLGTSFEKYLILK
jgi:hypothetical protein